jgi:hypothetical protein
MASADGLAAACFNLARTAKWTQKRIDATEITALANRFEAIARSRVTESLGIDGALLARAVQYITQAHGPPFGDDTLWFEFMLSAVVEVARPNSGLDQDGQAILHDMLDGIQSSLAETND